MMIRDRNITRGIGVAFMLLCVSAVGETTAFVGVNVIPMSSAGILGDHTVIVDDVRIAAIGPRSSTSIPNGATHIDGKGKYLIPGLTDVHVHFLAPKSMEVITGEDGPKLKPIENTLYLYLAAGVTTVRVMAGFPELLEVRDAIARGEMLGPRLIVCTQAFDGPKPILGEFLGRAISSQEEARSAVQESKTAGYDLIKVYTLLARDSYDAMMEEAHKVGLKVVGHVPLAAGLEHALASGQAEITHGEEFWRFTRDYGDEVVKKYTKMAVDAGISFSPTISTYQNIQNQLLDIDSMLKRPDLQYIDPLVILFWAPPYNRYVRGNASQENLAKRARRFDPQLDFARRLVKSMHEAGVPIVTGTDALNPMSMPGFAVHDELAELVNAGLPPWEALRSSTARPAEFMEKSAEWGSITEGSTADLVLLSANPLDDIDNAKKIAGVMRQGQWLSRTEIDEQLEKFATEYANE
jgi:imidazolonepropionase-like amidohydrolase